MIQGQARYRFESVVGRALPGLRVLILTSLLVLGMIEPARGQSVNAQVGDAQIEVSAAGAGIFRLSIAYGKKPVAFKSVYLNDAPAKQVTAESVRDGAMVGIKLASGSLLINPSDGTWTLKDHDGKVLIRPTKLWQRDSAADAANPTIDLNVAVEAGKPVQVYGVGNNTNTLAAPSTAPAVEGRGGRGGRGGGGGGRGGGRGTASLLANQGRPRVGNGVASVPFYWAPIGYSCLMVGGDDNAPATWDTQPGSDFLTWHVRGTQADLYLMPARTMYDSSRAYGELTGRPTVPPMWAFGYLQSRWGWTDKAYIDDTAKRFSEGKFPVDAFIYDFEWYTKKPDYEVPAAGEAGFEDFIFNSDLFPEPAKQIAELKSKGIRFVGIRKPRLGNADLLKAFHEKNWILPSAGGGQLMNSRVLDYRNPEVSAWYTEKLKPLLEAGVDGWWNDEGEQNFTTYYYWTKSEQDALNKYTPGQRLWVINRAFQPGVQRLGAAAWNGDIQTSWPSLARTPGDLLNWSTAGMPYVACDIGGFTGQVTPELLTRWMQAGVFFPVMRAHSTRNVQPRFPWLYGPEAEAAIRKALNLRYRLIPMYYSLAYEAHETGAPIMRPLVMEFPSDPKVMDLSDQWLIGRSVMAAPVLQEGATARSVYFPDDTWYVIDSGKKVSPKSTENVGAALDQVPTYVRAGTILPLAPLIQHTSDLPGGPLDLQIYPGKNATFTLVEDDGQTTAYLTGNLRRTTFTWNDATRELSWKVEGTYNGKTIFKEMQVTVFDEQPKKVAARTIDSGGGMVRVP